MLPNSCKSHKWKKTDLNVFDSPNYMSELILLQAIPNKVNGKNHNHSQLSHDLSFKVFYITVVISFNAHWDSCPQLGGLVAHTHRILIIQQNIKATFLFIKEPIYVLVFFQLDFYFPVLCSDTGSAYQKELGQQLRVHRFNPGKKMLVRWIPSQRDKDKV